MFSTQPQVVRDTEAEMPLLERFSLGGSALERGSLEKPHFPWRREWPPTPVFLCGKSQRSLVSSKSVGLQRSPHMTATEEDDSSS